MYSLDVNFLKDRHLDDASKSAATTRTSAPVSLRKWIPMYIGMGIGAGLVALTALLGILLNWQKAETTANIQTLDGKIAELNASNQKLADLEAQVQSLDSETQALVSVFNQIKPWSALLQEFRIQTPPNVQISGIQQVELPAEPDKGEPQARTQIKISGYARNFEDVSNFLLTLQGSPFLKATRTQIDSAKEAELPIEVKDTPVNVTVTFPKGIEYVISTELNSTPSAKLLPDLARNGAVGLVTRIQKLEQQGVIQR